MPDYNKGDFTQQGIDGFVEGGLHLNEKRCLTAKISTDEDSAGLDSVEINIHDHLNDLDYTITGENLVVGENTIGGGGGGDNLIKCVVTLKNESGNRRQFGANTLAILNEDGTLDLHPPVLDVNETKIITLLLLTDAGDRLFCVVTDGTITTSNENDCLITDSCLYPSDETVTECSITIALKRQ